MTTKTKMPIWVADQLIADGRMNHERITTTARARTCKTCATKTLTGLNEYGRRIDVDPIPINALGEVAATLAGRTTYGCFYGELTARQPSEITYRPPSIRPVYATHECHAPPLPPEPKFIALTRPTPTADDYPPF
jgi:hypothetical protein